MIINEMQISDLQKIKENLKTDYDDFWNFNILESEILNKDRKYFTATENEEILGFVGISFILDEAELMNIVVKKDKRKMRYRKSFIGKNN